MARQLILFACLVAAVFSAENCFFIMMPGANGGACPQGDKLINSACYLCLDMALPPNCKELGQIAVLGACPARSDYVIQYGLGPAKDPSGAGICTRC